MMLNLKKHEYYYLSLIGIFFVFIILFLQFSYDKTIQTYLAIGMVLFYILWGIIHHIINHDISFKIVVEYILIGLLGFSLILFFLKGTA